MELNILGLEIENVEIIIPLWIGAIILSYFLFAFWISKSPPQLKGFFIQMEIFVDILALPIVYFMVKHQANK